MSEELYPYYEKELLFIRQLTQEFRKRHPGAAGRLLLEEHKSADPHVEKLLEAFALLASRIHQKLDDEFPELTDALLQVLYPHYLAPIPSLAIVQFELDPTRGQFPQGFRIESHSPLTTPAVEGVSCKYRTTYPVTLWPVQIVSARFQTPPFSPGLVPPPGTAAALTLELRCQGQEKFNQLELDQLRLFLSGDNQVIPPLYELLFNHALQVVFRDPSLPPSQVGPGSKPAGNQILMQPDTCLRPVGFHEEECLLPNPGRSLPGYRLLTEYFAFPAKFLFVDLGGWARVRRAGFQHRCEITIFFNRTLKSLEQGVDVGTFRLGCSPVVNLFDQTVDSLPLTSTRYEYPLLPDTTHPQGVEIYSVDVVTSMDPNTGQITQHQPFYSFRHLQSQENTDVFWYTSRQPSLGENDRGTDVSLHLVDIDFNPALPADKSVTVKATCTNRGQPLHFQGAEEGFPFTLEAAAPLAGIRCLRPPTAPLRTYQRRGWAWRLVSHLNLNQLSLTDGLVSREAFQEILRLYDFADPDAGQQQLTVQIRQLIDGIDSLDCRRVLGRLPGELASGFCRGIEVTITFDEEKFVGANLLLFASVLENFLSLYVSINSFSQLVARSKKTGNLIKKWPPRRGAQLLV